MDPIVTSERWTMIWSHSKLINLFPNLVPNVPILIRQYLVYMIIVVQQTGPEITFTIDTSSMANTLIMAGALTATIVTATTTMITILSQGGAPIQI